MTTAPRAPSCAFLAGFPQPVPLCGAAAAGLERPAGAPDFQTVTVKHPGRRRGAHRDLRFKSAPRGGHLDLELQRLLPQLVSLPPQSLRLLIHHSPQNGAFRARLRQQPRVRGGRD